MEEITPQASNNTVVGTEDFIQEKQCTYDGERYCVRDNGAVLRYPREGKRVRRDDNQWTFGKETSANPYLYIGSVRVHRVVAFAFHGEPPAPTYVTDHIDTNCRNNRPGNLRWLTRLENALKNPATRKKIEYLCGSIEAFLKNPSMLNDLSNPNFKWMRTVTPEEANNCMVRMAFWASSANNVARSNIPIERKSSFSERVYKPLQKWEVGLGREPGLEMALTPWCAQYMWRASAYFPCCPREFGADPVDDYFQNLKSGAVLAYCDDDADICPKLTIVDSAIFKEQSSIVVMSERADGKWAIVGIELHGSRHFVHFILGLYSSKDEADTAFCGKEKLTDFWSKGYTNARFE